MPEDIIIQQCAPTLAAIKTGSMFSCPCDDRGKLLLEIRSFNQKYGAKGLCLLLLRFWEKRVLLLLIRPACLQRDLTDQTAQSLLKEEGYRCENCYCCLSALIRRFREEKDFPHEVGLFLGYPPEDVRGFIENRADRYKCAGLWKVYGDEQEAKRRFAEFRRCTERYCSMRQAGADLEQLTVST